MAPTAKRLAKSKPSHCWQIAFRWFASASTAIVAQQTSQFLLHHCLNLSFFLFIQRGFGRQCAWMVRLACFVACLIEKIKPIISVGSDRFNFEWIKRYERICNKGYMLLDTVPDFDWTIRQSVLRIGLICRWIGRGDCCRHLYLPSDPFHLGWITRYGRIQF